VEVGVEVAVGVGVTPPHIACGDTVIV
jgi:hypothetical protein